MNRIVSTVIVRVPGFSVDEASHLRAPAPPLAGCRVLVGIGGEERLDGGGVAQLPRVQRIARIRRVSPREFTEGPLQNPPSHSTSKAMNTVEVWGLAPASAGMPWWE